MKRAIPATITMLTAVLFMAASAVSTGAAGKTGEDLFKEHCAACHPGGGNIINPKKTLHAEDLAANKIDGEQAIVRLMRSPGPGMLTFDARTLPDKDARAIARYILKTFGGK